MTEYPIKLFGVEVEAGWFPSCEYKNGSPACKLQKTGKFCTHENIDLTDFSKWRLEHDGSIRVQNPVGSEFSVAQEIVSPPLPKAELQEQMERIWKKINRVNDTMGMHIHVSMNKKRYYYILSSWDYVDYFQNRIINEQPDIIPRLSNRYSMAYADKSDFMKRYARQVEMADKHDMRYNVMNFAWRRYGTIEYRVFPMKESVKRAKGYLDFVEDSIIKFINENGDKNIESKINATEELGDEVFSLKPAQAILIPNTELKSRMFSFNSFKIKRDTEGFRFRIGQKVVVVSDNFTSSSLSTDPTIIDLFIEDETKFTVFTRKRNTNTGRIVYCLQGRSEDIRIFVDEMDIAAANTGNYVTNDVVDYSLGEIVQFTNPEASREAGMINSSVVNTFRNHVGFVTDIRNNRQGRSDVKVSFYLSEYGAQVYWLSPASLTSVSEFNGHPPIRYGDTVEIMSNRGTEGCSFYNSRARHFYANRTHVTFTVMRFDWCWVVPGGTGSPFPSLLVRIRPLHNAFGIIDDANFEYSDLRLLSHNQVDTPVYSERFLSGSEGEPRVEIPPEDSWIADEDYGNCPSCSRPLGEGQLMMDCDACQITIHSNCYNQHIVSRTHTRNVEDAGA